MNDGSYVYYTISCRTTHKSPWLKPDDPLVEVSPEDSCAQWGNCGGDYFGGKAEPWAGSGNDWKPQFRESHDETHQVWSKTGCMLGWWSLKYAVIGLHRLQEADAAGKFDYRDHSNCRRTQAVRHEYRILKVTTSQQTETISVDDLMKALAAV